ncbi:cytochrome P450 [Gymnopilus junonius]|uniref:Cytochrome P450 n=1 Tax=Gymnopilus junonius TaxID=109634 RepID=A0A9P5TMM8_GYMJU|nr:cytochrome P450 [Gymnopilus junonius]
MDILPRSSVLAAAAIGGLVFYYALSSKKRSKHLPPGPRGLPIIGNVLQMPVEMPWMAFSEWGKTYGDIIQVNILGQPILIINSTRVAKELLDKRSAIYSDRPRFVMAGDLVGYDETFVLQPYGENWRKQRRLIAQDFSLSSTPKYYSLQEKEAAILVRNLLKDSSSLVEQIKLRIGIIIIRVTYGHYIQTPDDPFLTTPLQAMVNFGISTTPGNFMVDFIPALKHLPAWMPGAGFLQTAKKWRQIVWDASWNPYEWCKKNMDTGKTLMPNLCGTYINEAGGKLTHDDEMKIVWAASSVMGGGLDTNMSSALSFFMAMILNPQIQAKAQAELDAVVGKDRLPTLADKPNLPYIRSIMAEVFRWSPAIPLGIPHATSEDDIFEGYEIPKGTLIMPNAWHMLHDPEIYPNPMQFIPERYNGSDEEMFKVTLSFGFGRRICPGMHFAEGTLFSIIATTLATCDILPGLDANGKEVIPKYAYTPGTITFPESFPVRLRPRSPQATSLLSDVQYTIE